MKLSAKRRDEILDRLVRERHMVGRLKVSLDATNADLKNIKEEMKTRLAQILVLCEELDGVEQVCEGCGVVREIGETRWPENKTCPECAAADAKEQEGGEE